MSDVRKKKSGVFVWAVMGFLVLGLGGFGLTGAFQTSGGSTVATVGNEEITADAYLGTLQQDLRRASQQYGQNISFDQARLLGIDQSSLRRQLTLAALANEAKRLNLSVGDATVRDVLLANPAFQIAEGVFSEATYDLVLNQQQITRAEYEDLLRQDQTQTLVSSAISGAIGPQKTQKTPSGIIIPDTAKEKPQMGEVIAVGEGKLLNNGEIKPLKVKEGDVVLFNKYAGTEVELDGEKYLIMSEDEVLAIVEDAKVTA